MAHVYVLCDGFQCPINIDRETSKVHIEAPRTNSEEWGRMQVIRKKNNMIISSIPAPSHITRSLFSMVLCSSLSPSSKQDLLRVYCHTQARTWGQELGHTHRVFMSERTMKGNHKFGQGFLQDTSLTNQRVFKQFNVSVWKKRNCDLHLSHWFGDENFISGFRGEGRSSGLALVCLKILL